MGEEADALDDQSDGGAGEWCDEQDRLAYHSNIDKMKARYRDNKRSQVGTTIRCTACNKRILKSNYQTQFCSNKGKGNCKDKYWNCAIPKRLTRSQIINR
jgi:hypothetical protein